jgi:hypothetical protein
LRDFRSRLELKPDGLNKGNLYVTITDHASFIFPRQLCLPIAKQFETQEGRPFEDWFVGLNPPAAAKVTTAIIRMEQGNFSRVKGIGAGV